MEHQVPHKETEVGGGGSRGQEPDPIQSHLSVLAGTTHVWPPVNMSRAVEGVTHWRLQDKMRVREVWLGFKRPSSCRAFSCMKSWSLVPPQATVFQALVICEEPQ